MSTLAYLQKELQRSIVTGNSELARDMAVDGIDIEKRVGVYATAYRLRLIDALAANFPRLRNFLGEDAFAAMAREYLDGHPSQDVSVRWFGHRLSGFLRDNEEFASRPWLAELAQWEWAIAGAFDAADAAAIELNALQIAPDRWPQLKFNLHPSVRLLRLSTDAVSLFREEITPADESRPGRNLDRPQSFVIWRQQLDVRFREQSDDEAHALASIGNGGTFEAMCAGLCDRIDAEEVPTRAASLLKTWVLEGLIAAVVTST